MPESKLVSKCKIFKVCDCHGMYGRDCWQCEDGFIEVDELGFDGIYIIEHEEGCDCDANESRVESVDSSIIGDALL
jgi:hypothetical protein